jgi:hypothetical protein
MTRLDETGSMPVPYEELSDAARWVFLVSVGAIAAGGVVEAFP